MIDGEHGPGIRETPEKRPDAPGIPVQVRLQPPDLAALDAYTASSTTPLTRPQAVRAILADWLRGHGFLDYAGDHPKPVGPATDVIERMHGDIEKDKAKRKR